MSQQPMINQSMIKQSIINISLLVKLAQDYGYDPVPLLASANIDSELLQDPNATISQLQELEFVRALIHLIDEPCLGFYAGQNYKLTSFGNLGMAVATCETVGDAIQLFLKYIQLSYTHFAITLSQANGHATLHFNDQYDLAELRQFYIERDYSFILISTRDMFPRSLDDQKFKAIHFDYPCPTNIEQYEKLYECQVHFDMPCNQIIFDERYLARLLPQANPLSRQLLEEQCENQAIRILGPSSINQILRECIRDAMELADGNIPNLENIALKLHTTSRTLRRKLKVENTTFQILLADELSKKAIQLLKTTPLTVEQIASELGYSESASFIHAFKRWTGKVPKNYR